MALALDNKTRHRAVREALLADISALKPGERLPTVKSMMERFEVSQATIDRALRGLREAGLVESRVGSGTFVARQRKTSEGLGLIDLFAFGTDRMVKNPGFHNDLVNELAHRLGRDGRGLRVTVFPRNAEEAAVVDRMEQLSSSAVIVMYPTSPAFGASLAARRVPYVQVIPYWPVDLPNSFMLDNRAIVQCWIKHLTGMGHSRIAYLHGVLPSEYNRDMNDRLHIFYEEMAKAKIVPDPEMLLYGGFETAEGYDGAKELLRRTRDFTAVIIDDHAASGVYRAFEEAGMRVGRDVSVIGVDDLDFVARLSPPMTTVRISRSALADGVIESLEKMHSGDSAGFDRSLLPVRLVERESVWNLSVKS